MERTNVYLKNFTGTSYEVGIQIGNWILSAPVLLQRALLPPIPIPMINLRRSPLCWMNTVPVSTRRFWAFQTPSAFMRNRSSSTQ